MKQTGKFRRFLSLALMLALTLSMLPVPGAAEGFRQYAYLVIQDKTLENRVVNFRNSPNTNDTTNYPIARLPEYWVVQVLATATGGGHKWYQVIANVNLSGGTPLYRTGYIMAEYVQIMSTQDIASWLNNQTDMYVPGQSAPTQVPTVSEKPVEGNTPTPTPYPVGQNGFIRTVVGSVNLRLSPDGKVINENNQIPLGTVLAYYSLTTVGAYRWALVQYNGKAGYVRSDCFQFCDASGNIIDVGVTPTPPAATPTPTSAIPTNTTAAYYGKVTEDNVFFRKAMSYRADYWAKLPAGWTLEVTDTTVFNNKIIWYKVRGGIPSNPTATYIGYIDGDYFEMINTPTAAPGPVTEAPTAAPVTGVPSAGNYIKIVKDKVNIRKTPGGTVLTPTAESKLRLGVVLPYTEGPVEAYMDNQKYSWVKITWGSITGYVRSDCYQYCDATGKTVSAPTPLPTASPTPYAGVVTPAPTGSITEQGYIKLIKGGVNLRRTPGGESQLQLARGTILPYFNIVRTSAYSSETWYEVYYAQKGIFGYIMTTMAELCDASGKTITPTPVPTAAPDTIVGYVATTASSVWLRRYANADAETVGQVKAKGTVLTQVGPVVRNGVYDWYPVRAEDGTTAYIRGDYVFVLAQWQLDEYKSTGKVPTPTPGPATPKPGNSSYIITTAGGLWIRETPSTQAGTLGKLSKDTVLQFYSTRITGKGTYAQVTWYEIRYKGKTGWVHGNYVRVLTNAEYEAMYATSTPYVPTAAPGEPTPTPTGIIAPSATVPGQPTVYRTLRLNSTGSDVYALQYKLAQLGYLAWDQVTGTYLNSTEKAVIRFQKDNKLTVDGLAGKQTQTALYNYVSPGVTATPQPGVTVPPSDYTGSVTVTLYPVEKIDWFTGNIQSIWSVGTVAIITDVYTGISFRAQRLYGDNHADCEPLDTSDTAAICAIFGVSKPQEIEDREQELQSWRRRPLWVTIGGRTFCASMYGIPHNYDGDRIPDNGYNGQFCVHFTNSRTHTTNIVDVDASYNGNFGHQSAIQYAYEHSISGWK
ncbi:MAG: SH3 domain-containing protein [Clostridia bacterium]|nr:SH3 domain-containing protein [Clostridia bacterium]